MSTSVWEGYLDLGDCIGCVLCPFCPPLRCCDLRFDLVGATLEASDSDAREFGALLWCSCLGVVGSLAGTLFSLFIWIPDSIIPMFVRPSGSLIGALFGASSALVGRGSGIVGFASIFSCTPITDGSTCVGLMGGAATDFLLCGDSPYSIMS